MKELEMKEKEHNAKDKIWTLTDAGLNLKDRKKEKRLLICGKRNNRGMKPDGEFEKLDLYDKMVLDEKDIKIAIERWVFKAKYNLISKLVG